MFEEFSVKDRWSGEELHCRWKGTQVAIATRHADAVDVRFEVNGRPIWIALPLEAWGRQKLLTGKVITDQLGLTEQEAKILEFIRLHRTANEMELRKVLNTRRVVGIVNRLIQKAAAQGLLLIAKKGVGEDGEAYEYTGT